MPPPAAAAAAAATASEPKSITLTAEDDDDGADEEGAELSPPTGDVALLAARLAGRLFILKAAAPPTLPLPLLPPARTKCSQASRARDRVDATTLEKRTSRAAANCSSAAGLRAVHADTSHSSHDVSSSPRIGATRSRRSSRSMLRVTESSLLKLSLKVAMLSTSARKAASSSARRPPLPLPPPPLLPLLLLLLLLAWPPVMVRNKSPAPDSPSASSSPSAPPPPLKPPLTLLLLPLPLLLLLLLPPSMPLRFVAIR